MNERQKKRMALRAAENNSLNKKYYEYILDSITSDDIDVSRLRDKQKLEFAFEMFHKEKVEGDSRCISRLDLLTEWLMGLCSTMGIAYTYYDIEQIGKLWGVRELGDFKNDWFKNVATKMIQLAQELGVDIEKYM